MKLKFLRRVYCLIFGHKKREFLYTKDELLRLNLMGGVFAPFKCSRCGYRSSEFTYPNLSSKE